MSRYAPYILLAALCGALFFWKLGSVPLIGEDEGLYAQCSREMVASGNYIVPTVSGEPFFDKPPLTYWLQSGCISVLGVNSLAVRFPSALAAVLLVGLVVLLGNAIFGHRAGLYAGYTLACCMLTTGLAHLGVVDEWFALTITLALGAFALAYLEIIPQYGYLAFWAAAGLSVMVKGPAGAVLIFSTVAAFLLIRKRGREIGRTMPILGILVFAVISVPWYVLLQKATGGAFLREFLIHQNLQRGMGKDFGHNWPFYLYLPIYLAGFFPWSVFVPYAWRSFVKLQVQDKIGEASLFVGVWMVSIMLVFSILPSKLASYIYPMFPASALLMGLMWSRAAQSEKHLSLKRCTVAAFVVAGLLAAAMLVGQAMLRKPIPGLPLPLALMGLSIIAGTALALRAAIANRIPGTFTALCAGTAGLLLAATTLGLPIAARTLADPTFDTAQVIRSFTRAKQVFAYKLAKGEAPTLGFYAERPIPLKKTPSDLRAALSDGINLIVVQKKGIEDLPQNSQLAAVVEPYYLYYCEQGHMK